AIPNRLCGSDLRLIGDARAQAKRPLQSSSFQHLHYLMTEARSSAPSFADGRYQLDRIVGEGSRKQVFLAHDTRLGREVAVGFLKLEGLDEVARSRLMHEARAMARLGDHPRIVPIFDAGEEHGQPYIVC